MTKKMLIDATHAEETRVAVIDDGRLAEFDYESAFRKPLKGNIYLAKVTRVEPSLQAAFVNFGGNRHGFLPFSEIHPDYFRIPVADREALIAEQEAALRRAEEAEAQAEAEDEKLMAGESAGETPSSGDGVEEVLDDRESVDEIGGDLALDGEAGTEAAAESAGVEDENEDEVNGNIVGGEDEDVNGNVSEETGEDSGRDRREHSGSSRFRRGRRGRGRSMAHGARRTERTGGDEIDEDQRFRFNLRRKYKIQEVIKRGQIMLIQVSKEERGNKGAAVGTYLSLPGRYCVLMPNSPRAGGVSRKIASYKDRAHMREIMKDLDVPKGMSVILRTAGVSRTKAEIKRDLDYLMRLWDGIRELTLESTAPALVYEEANLVKRAVRDLYSRDIDEVLVEGEEGFKAARDFMKKLMPSHVKKVVEFKNRPVPLFNHYKIESQIAEIGEPHVTLPSGGYLVINPTEALVSIDVNSGKATKERHIEETALRTNLEAADEVARQLRLRDLGGLIVVDFIDMEDRRNNAKLERRMREALSTDRARIQMGRISSFGLMELSRQRMSPSLTESQYEICSHCHGVGRIRTADAASILVLRAIEDEGLKGRAAQVVVQVSEAVALYIINHKRRNLAELEQRYGMSVLLRIDGTLGAAGFRIEVARPAAKDEDGDDEDDDEDTRDRAETAGARTQHDEEELGGGRNGRRRGRRGGRRRGGRDERPESAEYEHGKVPRKSESMEKEEKEEEKSVPIPPEIKEPEETTAAPDEESQKKKPGRARKSGTKRAGENEEESKPEKSADEEKPARGSPAQPQPAETDSSGSPRRAPTPVKSQEYEVITEAPTARKKGWWNRLME